MFDKEEINLLRDQNCIGTRIYIYNDDVVLKKKYCITQIEK